MNNPILYQGLFGLVTVFFLVAIYFFTKTWRWFHIVCVSFLFFASIFLVRNTAAVYRTWNAWRSMVTKTTPQVERLEEENYSLRFGSVDDTDQVVESMRLLQAKIGRITLDAGRIWRHCTPTGLQPDGTVTLNTVPPGPPAAAPGDLDVAAAGEAPVARPTPPPAAIQDQTVLYAFLENIPPPDAGVPAGTRVPQYYIGDFVVTASTNTSVTLKPLSPLSAYDRTVVSTPNSTWALYDTMPIDGHAWFAKDPEQKPNWNRPASEEPVFGTIDDAATTSMLKWPRFVQQTFQGPQAAKEFEDASKVVDAGVQEYLMDGKSVANKDEFPPRLVWTKVRFLKAHKEPVDSGAKVSPFAPGVTDDFFDRGMAEVAILQLGKDADFKTDDVAIFPQDDAQRLIDAGICKFEEYVYVRRLNDYGYLFSSFPRRFDRINEDIEQVQRDLAALQQAQTNINSQMTTANDEQAKLRQDLVKTNYEAQKIGEYLAVLEQAWSNRKAQLSLLYRTNNELEQELERRSQEMTDEINRRTIQAIAEK